jgi:hypothetical protein
LLGKPPLTDVSVLSPSHGWAAGGLVATAQDLARFYRTLYRGQLTYLAEAWNSKDGKRQAVLLVNLGELSRTDRASAPIQKAVETAYCTRIPK